MSLFDSFHPSLQEVLLSGLGWDNLRPVQEETYKAVALGSDVIVLAPTAGGKTESAFIPVIDLLLKSGGKGLGAIYLSPLKALINDQEDRITSMCTRAGLLVAVQHGDVALRDRWKFERDQDLPNILLTTPESLESLLGGSEAKTVFSNVQYVIIDEIHAFMESDRGVHLRCLLDRLEFAAAHRVQRIGLSATVGNPEDLLNWLSTPDRKKQLVKIPSPQSPKKFSFVIEKEFHLQVREVAKVVRGKKALIFVDSRSFAEKLITPLSDELTHVYIHHSSVSSEDRARAESAFDGSGEVCAICTSTLELGIDIGDLDLVVQYGPPKSVASFLQRLGRTGRRGKPAFMTFILKEPCDLLVSLAVIEAAMDHKAEMLRAPLFAYHVLIQQLFLLIKGKNALGRKALISSLGALTPFSTLSDEKFSLIFDYLVDEEYLSKDGDLYTAGPKAERELGRSNWLSLLSVIHDSGGYLAVLPDGTVVGTLDPRFAGGEPGKNFSFTGKSWRLLHRDDAHKRILIEPSSPKGSLSRPFWSGGGDAGGGAEATTLVCESVREILCRGRTKLPLPSDQKEMIEGLIQMLPDDFSSGTLHVRCEPEALGYSVVISTFAGMRINMILTRLLKNRMTKSHTIRHTGFAIRIFDWDTQDAGESVCGVLRELSLLDASLIADEFPTLPPENWKFGNLIPPLLLREMAASEYYLLSELLEVLQQKIILSKQ